jgi:hypothetical protein
VGGAGGELGLLGSAPTPRQDDVREISGCHVNQLRQRWAAT